MKCKFYVYSSRLPMSKNLESIDPIKVFRNRPEAKAFVSDAKNIRQYGEMTIVEHSNHAAPVLQERGVPA